MAKSKKRPLAVFRFRSYLILGVFIQQLRDVLADIDAQATIFVTPDPTTASVEANIVLLIEAETNVGKRVVGSVQARNNAYSVVKDDVYALLRYVQALADAAASEDASKAIITASGFDLRVNGVIQKPALAIKPTATPGMVKIVAKAVAKRAAYEWQMSSNNGASWTAVGTTLGAHTTAMGLAAGTRYLFRFRSTTPKEGTSGWSAPTVYIYTLPPTN